MRRITILDHQQIRRNLNNKIRIVLMLRILWIQFVIWRRSIKIWERLIENLFNKKLKINKKLPCLINSMKNWRGKLKHILLNRIEDIIRSSYYSKNYKWLKISSLLNDRNQKNYKMIYTFCFKNKKVKQKIFTPKTNFSIIFSIINKF